MSMASNSTYNESSVLDHLTLDELDYEQFLNKDIPAVLFLVLLCVIGVFGNIHTFLVYLKSKRFARLTFRVFMLWLSANDFIACLASIPFEIFDIRFSYTFGSAGACKFFRFLNHVVTLVSGGLLTAIAIQRFMSIRSIQPKEKTKKQFIVLNIISAGIVFVAICLSTPAFVFYGLNIKETNFPGLVGRDCTVLSEYQKIKYAGTYGGVIILLSSICCITCIVIYGQILCVIKRQMGKETERKKVKPTLPSMNSSSNVSSMDTQQDSSIENLEKQARFDVFTDKKQSTNKQSAGQSKFEKGRRLMISLIVATWVSYLGYLIYVFTMLVKVANPDLYNKSVRSITAILLRTYFINNVANPLVFCFIDRNFRDECAAFYKKRACGQKLLQKS